MWLDGKFKKCKSIIARYKLDVCIQKDYSVVCTVLTILNGNVVIILVLYILMYFTNI